MKAVLQRVTSASVTVDGRIVGAIDAGFVVLLGVGQGDTEADASRLADTVARLRIMADAHGKMNRSLLDVDGAALVISQFTLYADTAKGRRPSFTAAAAPDTAKQLYAFFVSELKRFGVSKVATGEFGAYMSVALTNDGPVTVVVEEGSYV